MPETLSLGATGTLPFSDTTLLLPYLLPRELATFARYQAWFFIRSHLFFFLFIKVSDRVQELHSRLGPCRSSGVAPLSPGQTCFVSFFFFFSICLLFFYCHICVSPWRYDRLYLPGQQGQTVYYHILPSPAVPRKPTPQKK